MEQCSLAQQLKKRPKGTCWPLFVKNSHSAPGMGHPFGFFRVSNTGNSVNLYMLPYDFPRLFRILSKASKAKKKGPMPSLLIANFSEYLKDTPCYYWKVLSI
jgi:hypothetical protein